MADIAAMFHQVRVPDSHRSFLRFMWWPNGNLAYDPEAYQMAVHPFGATYSPCVAIYALNLSINQVTDVPAAHCAKYLQRYFYVDDCLIGRDSVQALREVASHLQNHDFRLNKWRCNSVRTLIDIPEEDRVDGGMCLDLKLADTRRTLSVEWNKSTDAFSFTVKCPTDTVTRRVMLSYI
uniref:Reverse transcriptase domain-containing protein n=1 Tax=Schistocephalus solidus TaxID=70667 RepID=A0A0X3PW19_SCHSO